MAGNFRLEFLQRKLPKCNMSDYRVGYCEYQDEEGNKEKVLL